MGRILFAVDKGLIFDEITVIIVSMTMFFILSKICPVESNCYRKINLHVSNEAECI